MCRDLGIRIGAILTLAGLCSAPSFAEDSARDAAFALWKHAAISRYDYGYNKYCECHPVDPPETVVTVADNTVIGVRHIRTDTERVVPAEERNFEFYWTMDELFELIETAQARGAVVRAEYDPELGYPTSVFIDYSSTLIGDEIDVRVTRFAVAGP
jgi:hypothetical protein